MPNTSGQGRWFVRLAPWLLILGLVAFQAVNNWLWLTKNVVIPGWDRPAHLGRSLAYYATLTPLSWQGLFKASVQDPIRPPLPFVSAVPLYWVFGTSADVATMVNVVYWLILLASVYGLGAHLGGRRLGVWGAILVALTPLLYALSRSFYGEFVLTAMVALTLYLLVANQGFRQRGGAVGFGLALGLGMLTTRTYPVFVAGPVAIAVLRSDVLRSLWQRLRGGIRLSLPDLLIAVGGGVGVAGLWLLSNLTLARELGLGVWLFPAWSALTAVTIYLLLRKPRDPGVNCLSALSLAATIASVWYLPRIEAIRRILLYGFGVSDPRQRRLDLASIYTYTYYPRITVNEGLGLVFAVLLVVAVIGIAAWLVRKRSTGRTLWQADAAWWVLLLWPIVPCLLLTFSIYKESRAFAPALPGLALILAAGLLMMPWRRLGRAMLGLAVVWGLAQFVVISYAGANGPAQETQFWSPVLGQAGLFARGVHLELPDAGVTDPGYNIQPRVLALIDTRQQIMNRPPVRLGVLAHTAQINAGSFFYLVLTRYPRIEVVDLAPNYEGGDPTPRLYGYEYLLLKRHNEERNAQTQAAIDRILDDAPRLFKDAFALEGTYPLPDGDVAYLYRLRYWPDPALYQDLTQASQALTQEAHGDDALLLTSPELLAPLSRTGKVEADIYILADDAAARQELERIASEHRRLFVLSGGSNPGNFIKGWLNRYAYPASERWFGSVKLAIYGTTPLPPPEQASQMWGVRLGDRIELTGTDLPGGQSFKPGDVVSLTLFWQARLPVGQTLKVFVHLLDPQGRLVAQHDSEPAGGQQPTSSWKVDEPIVDRHGVLLPDELPTGRYQIVVGLYDPVNGDRLPVTASPSALPADHLVVGALSVGP